MCDSFTKYPSKEGDVIEVSMTPEEAWVWTRDLMAVDLHNLIYIQLLDTPRLIRIVYVLQYRINYADYEFLEYMIEELYTRPLQGKSNEEISITGMQERLTTGRNLLNNRSVVQLRTEDINALISVDQTKTNASDIRNLRTSKSKIEDAVSKALDVDDISDIEFTGIANCLDFYYDEKQHIRQPRKDLTADAVRENVPSPLHT
ncbi:unnamed protein product [Mytilus coruscus]|uniref:Uncharacterized protein n=1 Tax=Mytilus coruscus TaxID=42192 RepID=A0A6J7ZUV5_MYTCO|nr:unnamed protein product [Mytilus coruscus]